MFVAVGVLRDVGDAARFPATLHSRCTPIGRLFPSSLPKSLQAEALATWRFTHPKRSENILGAGTSYYRSEKHSTDITG